jgi:hypothetical protein
MGILYEAAAVEFWTEVVGNARASAEGADADSQAR